MLDLFSALVSSSIRVLSMVLITGVLYAGCGFVVSQWTKQKQQVVFPKNGEEKEAVVVANKREELKRGEGGGIGYKTFQKQQGVSSTALSKKEYKNLKTKIVRETSTQNNLLDMAEDPAFIYGEIRKHVKNHLTESEIKVICSMIRRNYKEKHQYTTEQLTDDFLRGELYALVKKPHHIRKKYELHYFKKIQKIVQQKTLL